MENRNFQGRKFIFNFRKVNPTFIKILWKIRKTHLFLYSCRHVKILYITCELLTEHPPPPSTASCSLSCRRSSCPPPQWRSCPHLWPLHNIVISLHTLQCWHDGIVNPTHSFTPSSLRFLIFLTCTLMLLPLRGQTMSWYYGPSVMLSWTCLCM